MQLVSLNVKHAAVVSCSLHLENFRRLLEWSYAWIC